MSVVRWCAGRGSAARSARCCRSHTMMKRSLSFSDELAPFRLDRPNVLRRRSRRKRRVESSAGAGRLHCGVLHRGERRQSDLCGHESVRMRKHGHRTDAATESFELLSVRDGLLVPAPAAADGGLRCRIEQHCKRVATHVSAPRRNGTDRDRRLLLSSELCKPCIGCAIAGASRALGKRVVPSCPVGTVGPAIPPMSSAPLSRTVVSP
jgi:hypothetical protein